VIFVIRLVRYTYNTMPKGKNTCQWLLLGSTELCGKSCMGKHCRAHLARLRKGPGTRPCQKCGRGVKNIYRLCQFCGYDRANNREWKRKNKTSKKEFARLAAIETRSHLKNGNGWSWSNDDSQHTLSVTQC